jgi:hypothetical protein
MPNPLFTGLAAMMEILPPVKHAGPVATLPARELT